MHAEWNLTVQDKVNSKVVRFILSVSFRILMKGGGGGGGQSMLTVVLGGGGMHIVGHMLGGSGGMLPHKNLTP